MIKSGNFTACHKTVNPDPYVTTCQQETCLCKFGGDCACFCSAVAAYVQECNRHGVPIYWRREGLCRMFILLYFKFAAVQSIKNLFHTVKFVSLFSRCRPRLL